MWRVRTVVACAVFVLALVSAPGGQSASAGPASLSLKVGSSEPGWVSLQVSGPQTGTVVVREVTGGRSVEVTRLVLRGGSAAREQGVRWRCAGRVRRFVARLRGSAVRAATAVVTTPSCADRLRMIVVPGRLRPGESASVRVTDAWRFGGIAARLCARPEGNATRCTRVRLAPDTTTKRAGVRLRAAGQRTIALSSEFGQRIERRVQVRDDARLRVLVTGDSIVFGLFQALAGDLGDHGSVRGDPQPGRGITNPHGFLDWPAHARRTARTDKPDVTVVFLGYADAGYPLVAESGETVACCDPPWVAAYATRVSAMMTSYLRDGRGLVYWVLLPTPRSAAKTRVARAENDAVRLAGRGFDDGVRVIEKVADVISPEGRYHDSIRIDGREQLVRDSDGVHLTALGIRIVTDIVRETLRSDALLD